MDTTKIAASSKKYFAIFIIVFILLAAIYAAYYLLPKAVLSLHLKNDRRPISLFISADQDTQIINFEESKIPVQTEQLTSEASENFPATGTKNEAGRSSGKAVIYNEFSTEEQPLVATTRLETEDGKIFRITKNVVVPGMTQLDSEIKPGAIEVDVVADQPGENFNIGPATFKIPGFQSNRAKFEKFYAKSAKAMEGGNSEGVIRTVTAQDITSAKEKISSISKKFAADELKKIMQTEKTLFEDLIEIETDDLQISDQAGTEKEQFFISYKIKASVLSVRNADVQEIIKKNLSEQGISTDSISFDKPLNYLLDSYDSQSKILKFSVKTDVKTSPEFDLDNFKKGIIGKSVEEAQSYANNFSDIQNMEISFWPIFFNRIPVNERRVIIEVE